MFCAPTSTVYTASLFWAANALMGNTIDPAFWYNSHSQNEQLVAMCTIIVAGTLWAYVVSTLTGIVISSNPEGTKFRHQMGYLNRLMARYRLPAPVCRRLREYMLQSKHLTMAETNKEIILRLSPALQGEVAWRINKKWLRRVWFLHSCETPFLVQLALTLQARVYAPNEMVARDSLYIIHRGVLLYGGRVLTAGKVWGEDVILQSEHLRTKAIGKAMNYLELFQIGRDELLELAMFYPDTFKVLRRKQILLALRRQLIVTARERVGLGPNDHMLLTEFVQKRDAKRELSMKTPSSSAKADGRPRSLSSKLLGSSSRRLRCDRPQPDDSQCDEMAVAGKIMGLADMGRPSKEVGPHRSLASIGSKGNLLSGDPGIHIVERPI